VDENDNAYEYRQSEQAAHHKCHFEKIFHGRTSFSRIRQLSFWASRRKKEVMNWPWQVKNP
jgi:hypothetical protein